MLLGAPLHAGVGGEEARTIMVEGKTSSMESSLLPTTTTTISVTSTRTNQSSTSSSSSSGGGGMFSSLLSGTDEGMAARQKAAHLRRLSFHLLSGNDGEEPHVGNREVLNYFLSVFSANVREYSAIQLLKSTVNTKGQRVLELPTAPTSMLKQMLFAHPAQHFLQVQVPALLDVWTALAHLFRCFLFRLSRDLFLSHFWPLFLPEIQHVLQLPTGCGISQRPLLQHAVIVLQLEAIKTIDMALTVSPTHFCDFRWWLMELRLSFATHTAPHLSQAYPTSSFLGTGLLTPSYEENEPHDEREPVTAPTTTRPAAASSPVCGASPPPPPSSRQTASPSPMLLHHQEEDRVCRWAIVRQGLGQAQRSLFYLPHPTTTAREAMGPVTFCGLLRWTPLPLLTTVHHVHPFSERTTAVRLALRSAALPRWPLPPLLSPRRSSFRQCRDREMSWLRLGRTTWQTHHETEVDEQSEKEAWETDRPTENDATKEKEEKEGVVMRLPDETATAPPESEGEEEEAFFRFLAARTAAAYAHRPQRCPWCCITLRERPLFESWEGVQFATRLVLRQYAFPALAPPPLCLPSSFPDAPSSYVRLGAPPSAWTWDVEAVRDCLWYDFYQSSVE